MAKTRRTRGTGSYDKVIDAKGNAFYRWRIGIYDPIAKKTAYKSIKAKSRDLLDEKVKAWKKQNSSNGGPLLPLPKRLTVEKWAEIWIETMKGKLTEATVYSYTITTNKYLIPNFGTQWIGQVSPLDLQRFFDGLANEISPNTISRIRAHFCACFELAVKFGEISRNPVKQTIPPKRKKVELKIMEEQDVQKLLEVAKSGEYLSSHKNETDVFTRKRNYFIVLLAVASGMRIGEILGLTWPCVDLSAAKIQVKHSLQCLPKNRKLKTTKNGKQRTIVIPNSVALELEAWREYQSGYAEQYKGLYVNPMNLVFTSCNGEFADNAYFVQYYFNGMRNSAGLQGIRFHDLRHFFASSALSRGVSVMAVSEQLGHSSIDITLRRYTHVLEKSRDELKEMLNANPLFKTTKEEANKDSIVKNN